MSKQKQERSEMNLPAYFYVGQSGSYSKDNVKYSWEIDHDGVISVRASAYELIGPAECLGAVEIMDTAGGAEYVAETIRELGGEALEAFQESIKAARSIAK